MKLRIRTLGRHLPSVFCALALAFVFASFAKVLLRPEWTDDSLGAQDWDLNFFYTESAARSLRGGEFPFWNPFYKGGMPLLENPQARSITPVTILAVFTDGVRATKISVLFHLLAGVAGSFFLIRTALGIQSQAMIVPVVLIPFCGYLPQHIFAGHANFLSIVLLPWAAAGFILFEKHEKLRYALLFSASIAWMVWDGHIYGFLQCVVLFGLWAVARFVILRDIRTIQRAILLALFTAGWTAPRLIPEVWYILEQGVYSDKQYTFLSLSNVLQIFLSHSQHPLFARNWPGQEYSWWEYGNYTGIIPLVLFALSLPFLRRDDWPVLMVLLFVLLLVPGDFHPLSPAHLLSALPGFGSMRSSGRWSILAIPLISILMAAGLDRALRRTGPRMRTGASVLLVLAAFAFCADIKSNRKPLEGIFNLGHAQDLVFRKNADIVTRVKMPDYGANSSQLAGILNTVSVRDGYDMLNSNTSALAEGEPGYRGEYYLLRGGEVKPLSWSQNRISFSILTDAPDTLIINQNYDSGWRATNGYGAESKNGLLSVPLQAGENAFEVYFRSDRAMRGFAAGLVFVFAAIGLHFRAARRARQ
jgi:hypothetical protein